MAMDKMQILYTRRFSDLGSLQKPHILQYALTKDAACEQSYGVSVTELYAGREDSQACRAICGSAQAACKLLIYLYENSVEPCAVRGVVENIQKTGALSF